MYREPNNSPPTRMPNSRASIDNCHRGIRVGCTQGAAAAVDRRRPEDHRNPYRPCRMHRLGRCLDTRLTVRAAEPGGNSRPSDPWKRDWPAPGRRLALVFGQ